MIPIPLAIRSYLDHLSPVSVSTHCPDQRSLHSDKKSFNDYYIFLIPINLKEFRDRYYFDLIGWSDFDDIRHHLMEFHGKRDVGI